MITFLQPTQNHTSGMGQFLDIPSFLNLYILHYIVYFFLIHWEGQKCLPFWSQILNRSGPISVGPERCRSWCTWCTRIGSDKNYRLSEHPTIQSEVSNSSGVCVEKILDPPPWGCLICPESSCLHNWMEKAYRYRRTVMCAIIGSKDTIL